MRALLPAFESPVFDAQRAFRAVLRALAEPGKPVRVQITLPDVGLSPAAAAAVLTLADAETPVWFAPSVFRLRDWLRFHTGASATGDATSAVFAVVGSFDELPALREFAQGTALAPESSATIIAEVADFTSGNQVVLTGPGIASRRTFAAAGIDTDRWRQLIENNARFPVGVDMLLCSGNEIVGLPRSTSIDSL